MGVFVIVIVNENNTTLNTAQLISDVRTGQVLWSECC